MFVCLFTQASDINIKSYTFGNIWMFEGFNMEGLMSLKRFADIATTQPTTQNKLKQL
jgi:hypothetical protein